MNDLTTTVNQIAEREQMFQTDRNAPVITGAEILVCTLIKQGVDTIFGFPGGSVIPIYDVLYDTKEIKHVLVRHEQGATHAADGYARATGKTGVVIVTSGPGASNTVTGIATAFMDSIPIVVFSGQVASSYIGKESFQEADIMGITRSITKHNFQIKSVDDVESVVKKAFFIARTGRPGPVVVDLPVDVMRAKTSFRPDTSEVSIAGYNPFTISDMESITQAAEIISKSKRPVIYAGGGIINSGAGQELRKLAEKMNSPVTTTLLGIGSFPENHPLSLGMLGMHGTWYANNAVTKADLLIAIGARFDDRVTGKISEFAPDAKIIHMDIDPSCINRNVKSSLALVGDAKNIMRKLTPIVSRCDSDEWIEKINKWKKEHPVYKEIKTSRGASAQKVIKTISQMTSRNTIIATDVGQNQMWTALHYTFTIPRTIITSGGLGTMGFGLPASIGAAIGMPERNVVAIIGDGGFQMTSAELATAVHYKVPVTIVLLNNGYLGMVRQWQQLFYKKRYASTEIGSSNPDFIKLAESYGAKAVRVDDIESFKSAFKKAVDDDSPFLIEVIIEREENVFPMVPAGESIIAMIEEE